MATYYPEYYDAWVETEALMNQWDDWVDRMIESEDAIEPEVEDWAYDEDGPKWREG
jgi:hypothetical protein